jgi:transcriptional regulator with XRE-family HTH domain
VSILISNNERRQAVVFPKQQQVLSVLGENIKLARKRRKLTQQLTSQRTGISSVTLRKIENGDPTVSIGHYLSVLAVLGLAGDFAEVALDDELGRKLQDAKLLSGKGAS